MNVSKSRTSNVAPNYVHGTKLEHLKLTACAKIAPVVLLLASRRRGIPCSKGK